MIVAAAQRSGDDERLWRLLRRYARPAVTAFAPMWAYGVDRVPVTGGFVLAANHFSAIDHPVLAALCPRPVCFASKAELFRHPLVGRALSRTGAFPVERGTGDRAALRRAVELVREGRVVGIHLEGTRQRSGRPGRFHAGAVAIARLADAPVVPCGLDTFGWSPSNRRACVAVFGEPIALDGLPRGRAGTRGGLELVGAEVVRLWEAARLARSLGLPDELPAGGLRSGPAGP